MAKPVKAHQSKPKHEHEPPAHVTLFISAHKDAAQKAGKTYNIPASVILAQSALESAWGKEAPSNMYFGKKGSAPDGKSVITTTHEETAQGTKIKIQDNFRAYDSYEQAAEDYGKLVTTSSLYAGALLHRKDPVRYVDALAKIYATASKYASKLKSIIKANNLQQYDEQGK